MKKNMIALAVAAAMVPGFAAAEGATISGYNDITWTHDNDSNLFWATTEVDIRNTMGDVTVGADIDINLLNSDNANNAVVLEQAFFAWNAAENVTVIGGKFNNPIGLDAEDTLDQPTTQAGLIYGILDTATGLHDGNNISGLAVAYDAGVATVTVGLLNEIQGQGNVSTYTSTDTQNDDNSIALVVNASPVEGLDLELGYVTMDDDAGTLGSSALDINASFNTGPITVTAEILDVDAYDDILYGVAGYYDVLEGTQVGLRYESNDNAEAGVGTDQTNLIVWHDLADNLILGAGYNMLSTGSDDDEQFVVEFLAKF